MKLVYHSDDIGLTPHVTSRILEAWRADKLDGFSIIANGKALHEVAAALAEETPRHARIGAHLNLFEGRPICPRETVRLLTDSSGCLNVTWAKLLRAEFLGPPAWREQFREQIGREWRAQIEVIEKTCAPRTIDCLDSHLHMHMLPFLFPLAAELADEFGIRQIRVTREVFHVSRAPRDSLSVAWCVNVVKHLILRWFARKAPSVAKRCGLEHADVLIGILYTGRMTQAAAETGIAAASRAGASSVDVLFHVGRASEEEAPYCSPFTCSPKRDEEFEALFRIRGDR